MMSKLKRPSGLLVFFSILFSAAVLFLSVRQLHGEDPGISGGAEGSTSIVTGTNEECKEPGSGTEECIVHTHTYTATETPISNCVLASYAAPTDDSTYCINTEITVSATIKGSNTAGKTTTTYSPCTICGQSYPGTNPVETTHNLIPIPCQIDIIISDIIRS